MTNHHPDKPELLASFENTRNTPDRSQRECDITSVAQRHDSPVDEDRRRDNLLSKKDEIRESINKGISLNLNRSERESYIESEAIKLGIHVDEYRRRYEKAEIRASFNNIKNTPDRLQEESDIAREAKRLEIDVDEYRRYYEMRREKSFIQELPPNGFHPFEWGKYFFWWLIFQKLPLSWRAILKNTAIIGATITAISTVTGVVQYVRDAPQRTKQARYQAWQIINSAKTSEASSAGRIDALQDLLENKGDLKNLNLNSAQLGQIKLPNADLNYTNFNYANLFKATLNNANLNNAKFVGTRLNSANLRGANLRGAIFVDADLRGADLHGADLNRAEIRGANLDGAKLYGAINIDPEEIKTANNWDKACYDSDLRQKLKLSQNPKCDG